MEKMEVGAEHDPEEVGQLIPAMVRTGLSLRSRSEVILRSNLGVSLKLGLVFSLWPGFRLRCQNQELVCGQVRVSLNPEPESF